MTSPLSLIIAQDDNTDDHLGIWVPQGLYHRSFPKSDKGDDGEGDMELR